MFPPDEEEKPGETDANALKKAKEDLESAQKALDKEDYLKAEEHLNYWHNLPGLGENSKVRVEIVDADLIARPGPRMVKGVEILAHLIFKDGAAREGGRQ